MTQTIELRVDPRTAAEETLLRVAASTAASVDPNRIRHLRITRRSIDARQRRVMVNLSVRLWIDEEPTSTSLIIPVDYKPLPADASGHSGGCRARRTFRSSASHRTGHTANSARARQGCRLATQGHGPHFARKTWWIPTQTTASAKVVQEPTPTANYIPAAKARTCRQNTQHSGPARRVGGHSRRCPPPHRHRPAAGRD